MDERPPRSLQVDAVPLGRRRTILAPVAVTLAAAVFVVAAVVKPWDAPGPGSAGGAGAASSGRGSAEAPPVSARAPSASVPPTPFPVPPTLEDLLAVARSRSEWGVRAVVVPAGRAPAGDGSGAGLEDRWTPVDDPGPRPRVGTRTVAAGTAIAGDGEAVLAMGVTTPPETLPLDVRIWRLDGQGAPQRIVPVPVPGPDPGSWLWRPGPAVATPAGAWPPGTYRIDVLLGPWIDRIVAVVPGEPSPVGRGEPGTSLPAGLAADVTPLGEGPFVIAGGRVSGVDVLASGWEAAVLDEREGWLLPGLDRPLRAVGRISSTDVAGIGVVLAPGAVRPRINLQTLSPVSATIQAPVAIVPLGPDPAAGSGSGAGRLAVVAHAGGGRPFAAGTYRVWASWTADGEARSDIWFIEVVPSTPVTPQGSPLDALRRFTGRAAQGATAGEPLVTAADLRPNRGTGTCGGGAIVARDTTLIGLALPAGERVTDIRLVAPDQFTWLDTRAMLPGPDGLALLALPTGGLVPGTYWIDVTRTVGEGTANTQGTAYDVCIR